MVQEDNPHQFTGFFDKFSDMIIITARRYRSWRMIVNQDERGRHMLDSIVKNLSRFSDTASGRADKNGLLMDDLILSIEIERHQVLLFFIP